jgi:hypothetical protein
MKSGAAEQAGGDIPCTFYLVRQHLLWRARLLRPKHLQYPYEINNLAAGWFGIAVDIRECRRQHLTAENVEGSVFRQKEQSRREFWPVPRQRWPARLAACQKSGRTHQIATHARARRAVRSLAAVSQDSPNGGCLNEKSRSGSVVRSHAAGFAGTGPAAARFDLAG